MHPATTDVLRFDVYEQSMRVIERAEDPGGQGEEGRVMCTTHPDRPAISENDMRTQAMCRDCYAEWQTRSRSRTSDDSVSGKRGG